MQPPMDSRGEAEPLVPADRRKTVSYTDPPTEESPTERTESKESKTWFPTTKATAKELLRANFAEREATRRKCALYRSDDILTWKVLLTTADSVWSRKTLWVTALMMFILSFVTAVFTLLIVQNPSSMQIDKFLKLSTFLNVFVGLLIGFFISSSMARWYSCADGVVCLCTAMRNLQREMFALGVDDWKADNILRYGVVSGYLLDFELQVAALPKQQRDEANLEKWNSLEKAEHTEYGELKLEEQDALAGITDTTAVIWMWIGTLIAKLASDGDIPPNSSPTYGRLMSLVTAAHDGIRQVRMAVMVQPPYLYVQMLAVLVHINNILNAIGFGSAWGNTVGSAYQLHEVANNGTSTDSGSEDMFGDTTRRCQNLVLSFCFSCAGPFIYQALLEVAIAIAQPFSSAEGNVPTLWLLTLLEKDLVDNKKLGQWFADRHEA